MEPSKVLELARESLLCGVCPNNGIRNQLNQFAALIEAELIKQGWKAPEQVKKAVEDERKACATIASNHECGDEDDIVCQHQNCASCIAGGILARSANE